jgi:hypothetical protein
MDPRVPRIREDDSEDDGVGLALCRFSEFTRRREFNVMTAIADSRTALSQNERSNKWEQ